MFERFKDAEKHHVLIDVKIEKFLIFLIVFLFGLLVLIQPIQNRKRIQKLEKQISEFKNIIEHNGLLPAGDRYDIN